MADEAPQLAAAISSNVTCRSIFDRYIPLVAARPYNSLPRLTTFHTLHIRLPACLTTEDCKTQLSNPNVIADVRRVPGSHVPTIGLEMLRNSIPTLDSNLSVNEVGGCASLRAILRVLRSLRCS